MFADNLKVHEEAPEKMRQTMRKVEDVSGAMGMTMGLRKCAVAHVRGGRVVRTGPLRLKPGTCICEIGDGHTYRCLGVSQLLKADLQRTKGAVRAEYKRREQRIWGLGLGGGRRTIHGASQFVGICGGQMDTETRTIMRHHKTHYRKAAPEKLYLPVED